MIDEKICVEEVEKSEWSRRLRNLNVDCLQGYLYGKPCEKSIFLDIFSDPKQAC